MRISSQRVLSHISTPSHLLHFRAKRRSFRSWWNARRTRSRCWRPSWPPQRTSRPSIRLNEIFFHRNRFEIWKKLFSNLVCHLEMYCLRLKIMKFLTQSLSRLTVNVKHLMVPKSETFIFRYFQNKDLDLSKAKEEFSKLKEKFPQEYR